MFRRWSYLFFLCRFHHSHVGPTKRISGIVRSTLQKPERLENMVGAKGPFQGPKIERSHFPCNLARPNSRRRFLVCNFLARIVLQVFDINFGKQILQTFLTDFIDFYIVWCCLGNSLGFLATLFSSAMGKFLTSCWFAIGPTLGDTPTLMLRCVGWQHSFYIFVFMHFLPFAGLHSPLTTLSVTYRVPLYDRERGAERFASVCRSWGGPRLAGFGVA